jgi:hypothetical protein
MYKECSLNVKNVFIELYRKTRRRPSNKYRYFGSAFIYPSIVGCTFVCYRCLFNVNV